MKDYRKLTLTLIAGWFLLAVGASALHLFTNNANRLGLSVAVAAMTPLVLFWVWFRVSAGFRQFVLSLDPRGLTALQAGRIVGFTFVVLEAHGLLPAIFAMPAGYGDMAIGATAALVAWKVAEPDHRKLFILWQALGIADLVNAVGLGVTVGLIDQHSVPMSLMTVLPLSLIPTFLVPLYMMLHIICIAQARSWRPATESAHPMATPLQPYARL